MKHYLRPLLLLCLPILLSACESDEDSEPDIARCMETKQINSAGYTFEKIYGGWDMITEERTFLNGVLLNYYTYTHDDEGRIITSQYFDEQNNVWYAPDAITYNADGRWVEVRSTNTTGDVYVYEAEYNDLGQIEQYTATVERNGNSSVRFTITYEWNGWNNTLRTYESPTLRTVTRYEFDPTLDNRRRVEQLALAFNSTSVAYNRNLYKRVMVSSNNLVNNTTTETTTDYNYTLNADGYRTELILTTTTGSGTPSVSTINFEYSCY